MDNNIFMAKKKRLHNQKGWRWLSIHFSNPNSKTRIFGLLVSGVSSLLCCLKQHLLSILCASAAV